MTLFLTAVAVKMVFLIAVALSKIEIEVKAAN